LWIWTPAEDLAEAVASLWATEANTMAFRERIVPREKECLKSLVCGFVFEQMGSKPHIRA
jgi:hypothetical protein